MKYNRSEIMKMAWQIRKNSGCTMSMALTTAWAATKAMVEAEEYGNTFCGHTKVYANVWENYGKSRTYIGAKVYTNGWNMKRDIKAGYINNKTGEWIAA